MSIQERERTARLEGWLGAWLGVEQGTPSALSGGVVLAASERAARSASAAIHADRVAAGREAWVTPAVFGWDSWVRERWLERNRAGLMLLNNLQEHALWRRIIQRSEAGSALLHPDRLAATAQQAYKLLANYAPGALEEKARSGWLGDALIFSGWLAEFETTCQREHLVSSSRLVAQLEKALRQEAGSDKTGLTGADSNRSGTRAPLLLIGFDRLLESQVRLLEAWGSWQMDQANSTEASEQVGERSGSKFYQAADSATELAACLSWLRQRLAAEPEARLLVITPGLEARRGELERTLLSSRRGTSEEPELDFEFSLGVPLGRVGVARSALLLLRWLAEPLAEAEVDWLLTSDHWAASANETTELAETMLQVRRRGMERPEWVLHEFVKVAGRSVGRTSGWGTRLSAAREKLHSAAGLQPPFDWASLAGELLETAGWPGFRAESSLVFQARERWRKVLEDCGSLGFDESEMSWAEFVSAVAHAVSVTVFASESSLARIQITEPLESAGQLADGVWFLGAQEEAWPGRGVPHPLLPVGLQRDAGMPHSSAAADWKLAQQATERLMRSADEVIFSYAERAGELEARPSRLLLQTIGTPEKLPDEFGVRDDAALGEPLTECFEDSSLVRYGKTKIDGGSGTLTSQSLCGFKAFGTARLNAGYWEPAEAGLNARQRGILLHTVLDRVWGGAATGGISSSDQLRQKVDLPDFVRPIVAKVIGERAEQERRNNFAARFPQRYLELEAERLTRLVSEWLAYEQTRLPFSVLSGETGREVVVAGLRLDLRLDRVDGLKDGSRLIIDYKSSDVGPAAWKGDRPDDVQLPLYATFAYVDDQLGDGTQELQGLVFGRIRAGDKDKLEFCGRVFDAAGQIVAWLPKSNGLMKDPLTEQQLDDWRRLIERLGQDFLEGRAEVNPKNGAKTCERCHLHAVCRVYENQPLAVELAGFEEDEAELSSEVRHE